MMTIPPSQWVPHALLLLVLMAAIYICLLIYVPLPDENAKLDRIIELLEAR